MGFSWLCRSGGDGSWKKMFAVGQIVLAVGLFMIADSTSPGPRSLS